MDGQFEYIDSVILFWTLEFRFKYRLTDVTLLIFSSVFKGPKKELQNQHIQIDHL